MKTKKVFALIFSILIVVALGIAIFHHLRAAKIQKEMKKEMEMTSFNQRVEAIKLNCQAEKILKEETCGDENKIYIVIKKWIEIVDPNDNYDMGLIFDYYNFNLDPLSKNRQEIETLYEKKKYGVYYEDYVQKQQEFQAIIEKSRKRAEIPKCK